MSDIFFLCCAKKELGIKHHSMDYIYDFMFEVYPAVFQTEH